MNYTACELMEIALDELAAKFSHETPAFFCLTCDYEIDESDYAAHDRQNHDITEEEK